MLTISVPEDIVQDRQDLNAASKSACVYERLECWE
jgi:hypothetical protein